MTLRPPDWQSDDGSVKLWRGDCLEILPQLEAGSVDAVVTDPPYGIGHVARASQIQGRESLKNPGRAGDAYGRFSGSIVGDDRAFDPAPLLRWPAVMWGANYYHARLPEGGWLIWDKKCGAFGNWHSADADLAWCSKKQSPRVFRMQWIGLVRGEVEKANGGQNRKSAHPNEKPVALMEWCMDRLEAGETILDPFMGSGTTGVACVKTGRKFLGVEIDEGYFNIAVNRIKKAIAEQKEMLPLEATA